MGTVTNYERCGAQLRVLTRPPRDGHKVGTVTTYSTCRAQVLDFARPLGDGYNLSSLQFVSDAACTNPASVRVVSDSRTSAARLDTCAS